MKEDPPKPGVIFWRAGPLQYRHPLLSECPRNQSGTVHQLGLLWEAVLDFSEFFLKTLSTWLPMSWWVSYERTCPYCAECSAVFDQKWHNPQAPPSLFTRSLPEWLFVSLDEESPQREMFCLCKRGKTKNGRNTT